VIPPATARIGVRSGSNGSIRAHCASVNDTSDQRSDDPNDTP
jgi:hypothetical protein